MSKLTRALAIALLAVSVPAGIVVAQQAGDDGAPTVEQTSEKESGPSADTRARLEDGRIAMIKGALKLTPEQETLWAPVEEKIRAHFDERRSKREAWRAKRADRRAERDKDGKRERLALPERLEKRSERMAERATRMNERAAKTKEFAEVMKPFYASLSDEQKEVAGHVLRRYGGDRGKRGHHGRRWAMGPGGHGKSCH